MGTAELATARARTDSTAMGSLLYYALPALGSYVMLSIFFLRRPRLLHTPQAPAFCPHLAAHRGGELGQGRKVGVAAIEGGVRIAIKVTGWAAVRGRMEEEGRSQGRWRGVVEQDVNWGKRPVQPGWTQGDESGVRGE